MYDLDYCQKHTAGHVASRPQPVGSLPLAKNAKHCTSRYYSERDWKRIKFLRAGRVLSELRYAPAAQWAGSTSSTSQLEYAGCYSSIVAAFIANRLSADSLVL